MKILHVVPSYLPAVRYGGPIVSVHGLCRALVEGGHDVHVFTTNVDGPGNSDVPLGVPVDLDGVKVHYFPSGRLRRLYHSPAMGEALRNDMPGFDVVHLHSVFLWPTHAAAQAARRAKRPYVLSPRGMLERDLIKRRNYLLKTAWIALIEKRTVEHAGAIHATSEREAEELRGFGFALPPVFVVPNGVDVPGEEASELRVPDAILQAVKDAPYLLYLGRINWKKGLDRLFDAMVEAPAVKLLLAGNDEEGYQTILEERASRLGVANRLLFLGPVHGSAKWLLYRRARALVLPSYSENFGNVVLEAMACGTPAIVTPEVGIAKMVEAGGAGMVAQGDPGSLGAALSLLYEDPQMAKEMGERGRQLVLDQFTWGSIAQEMAGIYRRLIAPPRIRRSEG